ncbi:MAG TPA: DJ-1/PfpI family protein [Candidatus Omnitrophota bacterium]|nr:DJ-1/PfpI family protein [Candidatus Omnitrophota bacterium]HPD84841.1 DJ-1/PfpI family protein [Candidatus Omnitrophota bacterium]HRZ03699.1 DJ-1/PfpI family protein [Candidatus Omnitrophota bacterium]
MKKIFGLALALVVAGAFLLPPVFAQDSMIKKAVFIIPQENFQDDEFAQPLAILENNEVLVTVASTTLNEATGMNGAKTTPDILVQDVNVDDFDAVVFIGGSGAAQYIDDPLAHKIAQEAIAKNKILGGICLAPRILANAGVLKDKNATVYPSEGDKLKTCGVNYTAKPVEKDGNIITADGPGSAKEFGETLLKALKAETK